MIPEEIKQFIPQPAIRSAGTSRLRRSFQVSYPPGNERKPVSISYLPSRDGDLPKIAKDLAKRLGFSTRSKMIRDAVGELWKLTSGSPVVPPWSFPVLLKDLSLELETNLSGAVITAIRWRESLSSKITLEA